MKMKVAGLLALLSLGLLKGCMIAAKPNLYPVQGPVAAMAPPLVFSSTITGAKSGKISLTLTNGELFQGNWANITASSINAKTPGSPASFPPQPNLSFAWDAIYGQGDFVAHILGNTIGQAILTGNHGTILQVEFHYPHGVAMDNKGNIFKMTW